MPSPRRRTATRAVSGVAVAVLALVLAGSPEPASARVESSVPHASTRARWAWPLEGPRRVGRPYEAPASRYSAGHRGIDVAAAPGTPVLAPQSGFLRFAGVVVDRPTVTVETGAGVLISIEPVTTALRPGDAIARGAQLGAAAAGGHCDGRCIHLGVRVRGDYVSPMLFFGGVARAVLLPLRPGDARADRSP